MSYFVATVMILFMAACGGPKMTEEDAKKAEFSLFENGMVVNEEAAANAVDVYCRFVDQNADAETAPSWLFKALEISVSFLEPDKAIEIGNKLMNLYPDYEKTPVGIFMLANMVYEEKLGDLDAAKALYEKIINDYPDNEFVPSAKQSIMNLGKTPEQLIREFEEMNVLDSLV